MATVSATSAQSPLVLSLDVGSSSVRTGLFDALGREVLNATVKHPIKLDTAQDGAATADPDLLLDALFSCIDQTLLTAGSAAAHIAGVGSCTFAGNIMGMDERGTPVTPLLTYADTRAAVAIPALRNSLDEETVRQRTGCRFHPSYSLAQLLWLRRTAPDSFAKAARWITLGEYLEGKLFKDCAVTSSVAAWSGLLDIHACDWDRELLALLGLETKHLSPVCDASTPREGLADDFARRWPQLASVPWFPAIGDGAAANVGSGCSTPDTVALTMGTSSAMRIAMERLDHPIPDGLWCYRIDKGRLLLGGALSEGGNVYQWMQSRLRETDEKKLLAAVAKPDAHGLTVLPFLAGERSPGWAGHARATIHGITLATTAEDIMAASLEAVAYRIGMIHERLAPFTQGGRIIASGGALAASPVWLGIIADVLGCEVAATPITEASARGAALLTLEYLGALQLADVQPEFSGVYQPDTNNHATYRAAMQRQRELYDKLVTPAG